MKLATTTADFNIAGIIDQKDVIDSLYESGFRYADYSFNNDLRNKCGVFSDSWQEYLKDLKNHADAKGVKFVQSHAPMGSPLSSGDEYKEFIAANKRCIEACEILGIDNTVVHSGHLKGVVTKEEYFERNKAFYMDLLPFAQEHGVYILTENFDKMCDPNKYWIDNARDLLEFVEFIDHPMLKVCWDVGHGNMHETPQDELIKTVGKHIYAVHIHDNGGNADTHIGPYFGTLNLDSLMHGLKEIGFDRYFTFEADGFFMPTYKKRTFEKDTRLFNPPLHIRILGEKLLYEIGKHILTSYDCFEE